MQAFCINDCRQRLIAVWVGQEKYACSNEKGHSSREAGTALRPGLLLVCLRARCDQDTAGSRPSLDRNKTRERPGPIQVPPRPARDQRKPTCSPVGDLCETFNGPRWGDASLVLVAWSGSDPPPVPNRAAPGPDLDLNNAISGTGSVLRVPDCAQLAVGLSSSRRQVRSEQHLGGAGFLGERAARWTRIRTTMTSQARSSSSGSNWSSPLLPGCMGRS